MSFIDKRYIIGIDLGTTNTAVSFVDLEVDKPAAQRIQLFNIPQLVGAGEFASGPVLPSFLYIPGKYDISKKEIKLPWKTGDDSFSGVFARDLGAKAPGRLVSSAKSWLCHDNADRQAKILPWGAVEDIQRVSPVEATARYLTHIKQAWNRSKGDDAELFLENQMITITVPASFDEVARDLTLEATAMAGLGEVMLLEEPLAAFYSWLIRNEQKWHDYVQPGELILVCDVGGGTTDFTLITLRDVDGSPRFERISVGDHLILGGDNIDLALARQVEMKLTKKKKQSVSGDRWKALCHQCRQAKEMILDGEADARKITLMGKGKKLIAGTLSASLDKEDVNRIVLDGFFPVLEATPPAKKAGKKGITEFGLPYESEPAITRHIGWFLEAHKKDVARILGRETPAPDLVLFNGGSLKSSQVQEQIRQAIRRWFQIDDETLPRVLENPNLDLAVARGAAYYGLVKVGKGVRVGSGSARSYYLGVAKQSAEDSTEKEEARAVCLIERGLDEGSRIELAGQSFEVLTNRPVSVELYSSSFRSGDRSGDVIEIDDTLTLLPPLQTVIRFGKKGVQKTIPVRVEAEYTEAGSLALWCRSLVSDHRWRLSFQVRTAGPSAGTAMADEDVFDESVIEDVCDHVRKVLKDEALQPKVDSLVKDIAEIIERPKDKWPLSLIRRVADELIKHPEIRKAGPVVEARWLNLVGFCLRPGFGDGFDAHRIPRIWKIYKKGPVHPKNPQVRSEWWIMWRRIAGGLKPGHQRQFIQDLSPVMFPKKGGKAKLPPQEHLEIWMAVANMEHLIAKDKIKWGDQLLSELLPKKVTPQHFWALSRIGARELLYGSVDRVIPPKKAGKWMDALMAENWADPKPVCQAIAQMGRKTGDRIRDLPPEQIEAALEWVKGCDDSEALVRKLTKVSQMEKQEENLIFGESLPAGIILKS